MGRTCSMHSSNIIFIKVLVGKLQKETTWKTGYSSEDNIIMDLRKTEWEVADWINLTQNRDQKRAVVNKILNFWVLQGIPRMTQVPDSLAISLCVRNIPII
jgi:hypothetical protein